MVSRPASSSWRFTPSGQSPPSSSPCASRKSRRRRCEPRASDSTAEAAPRGETEAKTMRMTMRTPTMRGARRTRTWGCWGRRRGEARARARGGDRGEGLGEGPGEGGRDVFLLRRRGVDYRTSSAPRRVGPGAAPRRRSERGARGGAPRDTSRGRRVGRGRGEVVRRAAAEGWRRRLLRGGGRRGGLAESGPSSRGAGRVFPRERSDDGRRARGIAGATAARGGVTVRLEEAERSDGGRLAGRRCRAPPRYERLKAE